MGVYLNPINAIGVPATANVPKRAAQLATAGEVMVRNPDTIPSTNATTMNMRPPFRFLRFDLLPERVASSKSSLRPDPYDIATSQVSNF
jgi:hypothetical protein